MKQSTIQLISTDFDGTLINHDREPRFPKALGEFFRQYQAAGGLWVINTGRTLEHLIEGFAMLGPDVEPDYAITSEREIFEKTSDGSWESFGDWNTQCREVHEELFVQSKPVFEKIMLHVNEQSGATMIFDGEHPAGLVAAHEDQMETILSFLETVRGEAPNLHHQRNMIYLRFCHLRYSKGSALEHLRDALGIARENTFAAGDHFNDISMLDGSVARFVACPANAVDAVRETVMATGGFASEALCGDGVLDALQSFLAMESGLDKSAEKK